MSNVKKINREESQFQYLGKWVNKDHFRAFVYNDKGEKQLAKSYQHFEQMIGSGVWFAEPVDASPKRKQKDGSVRADG
jgi:hypothetical protein